MMEIVASAIKKKKKHKKRKLIISLLVFIFMTVCLVSFFKRRINPTILDVCSSEVKMITSQVLNNAIIESYQDFAQTEFVTVEKNSTGNITFVQTNTQVVNALTNSIVDSCNTGLMKMGENGINLPFGSLLGIPILASLGPNLNIKFVPIGHLVYNYETILESSGINQTMHKVYLNIQANITLVYGGINPVLSTTHSVLIGETIIVGEVPDFILKGGNFN